MKAKLVRVEQATNLYFFFTTIMTIIRHSRTCVAYWKLLGPEMSSFVRRFFPLSLPFFPLASFFPLPVVDSEAVEVIVVDGGIDAVGPAGADGGAAVGGRAFCLTEC